MTKNNVFVGKGFCNQGLSVLSIFEVMNGNSSSFSWFILMMFGMLG